MSNVSVNTNTQILDLKSGRLTRDGFLLFNSLTRAINEATSDYVTTDAEQTLTNKTVTGYTKTAGLAGVVVDDAITGGVTDKAPSGDAVNNALLEVQALIDLRQLAGGIITLASYTVATLPDATIVGRLIYVTDESGGATPAHSNGTNWLRTSDNAIVS